MNPSIALSRSWPSSKNGSNPATPPVHGYVEMMAIARWRPVLGLGSSKNPPSAQCAAPNLAQTSHPETAASDLTPVVLTTLAYHTLSDNRFLRQASPLRNVLRPPLRQSPSGHPETTPSGTARRQRFSVPSVQHIRLRSSLRRLSAQRSWTPRPPAKKLLQKRTHDPK